MTEDEAKQKWCPMVRAVHFDHEGNEKFGGLNRGNVGTQCKCWASACMMWRWVPLLADDAFKDAVIKAAAEIGDKSENRAKAAKHVIANRAKYGLPTVPFDGFCGLAGEPRRA